MADTPALGTLLRHLLELLDGPVEEAYRRAGLRYRPRYTPVMRALIGLGPASIRAISHHAHLTHSAVSQTVAQMVKDGLVHSRPGDDARERIVALSASGRRMLPALERQWAIVDAAARGLDRELSVPLSAVVAEAIAALSGRSFGERIEQAAAARQRAKPHHYLHPHP